MTIIATIRRAEEFSPNSVENDSAVFNLLVTEIQACGFSTNEYNENDFCENYQGEKIIIHMARRNKTLLRLHELELNGCKVINRVEAILNCNRLKMTHCLNESILPDKKPLIVHTRDVICKEDFPFTKMWVKRAQGYTMCEQDVCFVDDISNLQSVMDQFHQRNIDTVVIENHLEGDLIKFYGVTDTDFFHWFYPNDQKHSKFGQEKNNGATTGFEFDQASLESNSRSVASQMRLDIWGGDAIISPEGKIHIIDFNDFPSFRPCRENAVKAMVMRVSDAITEIKEGVVNFS